MYHACTMSVPLCITFVLCVWLYVSRMLQEYGFMYLAYSMCMSLRVVYALSECLSVSHMYFVNALRYKRALSESLFILQLHMKGLHIIKVTLLVCTYVSLQTHPI